MACELERQSEAKAQLQHQKTILEDLRATADSTISQLNEHRLLIRDIRTAANDTREQTSSFLATATEVLSLTTRGLMHLRIIAQ